MLVSGGNRHQHQSQLRAKLYRLSVDGAWDDYGTGRVTIRLPVGGSGGEMLCMRSEIAPQEVLLRVPILPVTAAYELEGGKITWSQPSSPLLLIPTSAYDSTEGSSSVELALSFQDSEGCKDIFQHLSNVQRRARSNNVHSYKNINEGGSIFETEQRLCEESGVLSSNVGSNSIPGKMSSCLRQQTEGVEKVVASQPNVGSDIVVGNAPASRECMEYQLSTCIVNEKEVAEDATKPAVSTNIGNVEVCSVDNDSAVTSCLAPTDILTEQDTAILQTDRDNAVISTVDVEVEHLEDSECGNGSLEELDSSVKGPEATDSRRNDELHVVVGNPPSSDKDTNAKDAVEEAIQDLSLQQHDNAAIHKPVDDMNDKGGRVRGDDSTEFESTITLNNVCESGNSESPDDAEGKSEAAAENDVEVEVDATELGSDAVELEGAAAEKSSFSEKDVPEELNNGAETAKATQAVTFTSDDTTVEECHQDICINKKNVAEMEVALLPDEAEHGRTISLPQTPPVLQRNSEMEPFDETDPLRAQGASTNNAMRQRSPSEDNSSPLPMIRYVSMSPKVHLKPDEESSPTSFQMNKENHTHTSGFDHQILIEGECYSSPARMSLPSHNVGSENNTSNDHIRSYTKKKSLKYLDDDDEPEKDCSRDTDNDSTGSQCSFSMNPRVSLNSPVHVSHQHPGQDEQLINGGGMLKESSPASHQVNKGNLPPSPVDDIDSFEQGNSINFGEGCDGYGSLTAEDTPVTKSTVLCPLLSSSKEPPNSTTDEGDCSTEKFSPKTRILLAFQTGPIVHKPHSSLMPLSQDIEKSTWQSLPCPPSSVRTTSQTIHNGNIRKYRRRKRKHVPFNESEEAGKGDDDKGSLDRSVRAQTDDCATDKAKVKVKTSGLPVAPVLSLSKSSTFTNHSITKEGSFLSIEHDEASNDNIIMPTTCANCGRGEEGSTSLKSCTACKMVKYCSAACQKTHRSQHKKECRKRAAELHDEALFKQPPRKEDCPICFLKLPSLLSGRRYKTCCGKIICSGCIHANARMDGNVDELCPFCRTAAPTSEEIFKRLKKRVEIGDAEAMYDLGSCYAEGTHGLPLVKAFELYQRAAKLGCAEAYHNIGYSYFYGRGVGGNEKKAMHYWELAAMEGVVDSRHKLGILEKKAGNMDRAIKHFMIAAGGGSDPSLKAIKLLYTTGRATKDDYAKALKAYQASLSEIKSVDRDKAAAFSDSYKYY